MATKEYTPEEVAQHNKEDDLWAIWHGKVLDLTAFVHEHPGGLDVLMESAGACACLASPARADVRTGADASQAFDDIGHSDDAFRIAEEHQIGVLKGARDAGKPQVRHVPLPPRPGPVLGPLFTCSSNVLLTLCREIREHRL